MIRNDSAISDLGKMNVTVSAFCPCMDEVYLESTANHAFTFQNKKKIQNK